MSETKSGDRRKALLRNRFTEKYNEAAKNSAYSKVNFTAIYEAVGMEFGYSANHVRNIVKGYAA